MNLMFRIVLLLAEVLLALQFVSGQHESGLTSNKESTKQSKIPIGTLIQHAKSTRIVGGQIENPFNSHPWQVLVIVNNDLCGGTIIDNSFVLTAAHCVPNGVAITSSQIVAGAHTWCSLSTNGSISLFSESSQQSVKIKNVFRFHIPFNPKDQTFDLAILELSKPLIFNTFVQKANLPTKLFPPGTNVTVSGWGTTQEDGSISCSLRTVVLPIVSLSECQKGYPEIPSTKVCAGLPEGGKDSCQGDSGGPLVFVSDGVATVVGIVSYGRGCGRPGFYGVYTQVFHFVSWINTIISRKSVTRCASIKPHWIGDGFCDDELNNVGCLFDAGDCCGSEKTDSKAFCKSCKCIR